MLGTEAAGSINVILILLIALFTIIVGILIGLVFYLAGAYRRERSDNHKMVIEKLLKEVTAKELKKEIEEILKK